MSRSPFAAAIISSTSNPPTDRPLDAEAAVPAVKSRCGDRAQAEKIEKADDAAVAHWSQGRASRAPRHQDGSQHPPLPTVPDVSQPEAPERRPDRTALDDPKSRVGVKARARAASKSRTPQAEVRRREG